MSLEPSFRSTETRTDLPQERGAQASQEAALASKETSISFERPWPVSVLEQIQGFLAADPARIEILAAMCDGEWHDLTSLWRKAKKKRSIGIVGVGMVLNGLQEQLGLCIFENGTSETESAGCVDSSWRIKDEFMGILRAAVGTGGQAHWNTPEGQAFRLGATLTRREYRTGP